MKFIMVLGAVMFPMVAFSQIGINTSTPKKSLHVNGSLQVVNEFNVGGTESTAGNLGTAGQVLTSNGEGNAPQWTTPVQNSKTNNVEVYGTKLVIPPHSGGSSIQDWDNHSNTSFDVGSGNDAWWVISKKSFNYIHATNYYNASRMTIVYEYQGTPFDIENMFPILTAGNNSSYPDVFTASFVNLANTTTGKTRLTVSVARVDFTGNNGVSSNWGGSFLLNLLLAKKIL